MLKRLLMGSALVALLAGCGTTQSINAGQSDVVRGARGIVGTALIGAEGKTAQDQDKINETVARLCGTGVYTKSECARHDK